MTGSNCRSDLNVDGASNSADKSLAGAQSGTGLTPSPPTSQVPSITFLVYDNWNLIAEFNPDGSQAAEYFQGPNIDETLARQGPGGLSYYHHDALGSTVALTDAGGDLIERYSYDVYGAPMVKAPDGQLRTGSSYATVSTIPVANIFRKLVSMIIGTECTLRASGGSFKPTPCVLKEETQTCIATSAMSL